jgi:hypothetical protein
MSSDELEEAKQILEEEESDKFNEKRLFVAFHTEIILRKISPKSDKYDDVDMKHYIIAYQEINKFLSSFGKFN